MQSSVIFLSFAVAVLSGGCHVARGVGENGHGHGHADADAERPPPLCTDPACGWCAPVEHEHESRRGTPYVHAFHAEPAFLGRDLIVHVEREGDERGVEAEIEWALTRRLMLVAEVPYGWAEEAQGRGDVGVGVRALGIEMDRLLVSGQVSVEFPTAWDDLGAGETVVAPAVLAWADLGRWFTAQASVSVEHGTESQDREFAWAAVLAKSFPCRPLLGGHAVTCGHGPEQHAEEAHPHEEHGSVLSLFLEGRGTHGLRGPEEGSSAYEMLVGMSAPLTDGVDLRVGWTLLWEDAADEALHGWVAGLVVHL
jgi:hypothetical protein